MSDLSSSGTVNTGSPKKRTSPARNAIGLAALIAVVAWCWFEYSAKSGYNAAVSALDARTQDETKALMPVSEAESLLGKSPDGPGSEFKDTYQTFTKKTYTWRGLVKSYTLTAYYTKEIDPCLHHFATEGAKLEPEPVAVRSGPTATNVPATGRSRGGAAPEAPAKVPAKLPTEVPAKVPAKVPSEVPAKVPAAGPSEVPTKGSVPEKTPQAPK